MKWISVEKQLPKWGSPVIVAHRRYRRSSSGRWARLKKLGVTAATFWFEDLDGPRFTNGYDVVADPVAWMPLPAPPETSK